MQDVAVKVGVISQRCSRRYVSCIRTRRNWNEVFAITFSAWLKWFGAKQDLYTCCYWVHDTQYNDFMEIQRMQNTHLMDYGQYSVETFACLNWINLKFSCMDLEAPHWKYRKVWMQENKKWKTDIHSIYHWKCPSYCKSIRDNSLLSSNLKHVKNSSANRTIGHKCMN